MKKPKSQDNYVENLGMYYPRNQIEFEKEFATAKQCQNFLFRLRKMVGDFVCRECGHAEFWECQRGNAKYKCKECRTETSLLVGTIFEDSRVSLSIWFRAIWLFVNDKGGVSATSLERQLGIGSHKTSWTLLHKIRRACVNPDRKKLKGEVEVDEFSLGTPTKLGRGNHSTQKIVCMVAAEKNGRVRMEVTHNKAARTAMEFIERNVEKGSHIFTDNNPTSYIFVRSHGYQLTQSSTKTHPLPSADMAISQFRRFLNLTLQGAPDKAHMNEYFDEFAFRYNRRSFDRGLIFLRVLEYAVKLPPTLYREIVKDCSTRRKKKATLPPLQTPPQDTANDEYPF